MAEKSDKATDDVEEQKFKMPANMFDVVAENPQIKHIAKKMHKTSVKKHGGERAVQVYPLQQKRRNGAVGIDKHLRFFCRQKELMQVNGTIGNDHPDCDKRDDWGGVVIFDRYHGAWLLSS